VTDTKTLQDLDRNYVWHPFTQMREWEADQPIVVTMGEGSHLIDSDGNRYLDGVGSIWTNVHGHCKREINEAIKLQVDRLEHSTLLGLSDIHQPSGKKAGGCRSRGAYQGFLFR